MEEKMTKFERAVAYVNYCKDNGYTCDISYDIRTAQFLVTTGGGLYVYYFSGVWELTTWMAQRYDDEKEAGNIE